jgi:chromosome segregation ATPase
MIKKLILAAVALVALGAVYAIDPGGHASALSSYVKEWFKPSLDYQIRRAEGLIAQLDPAIKKDQEKLAREKVELGEMEETLAKDKVAIQKKHERLVALRNQFGKGEQLVSINPGKRNELARELSQLKIMDRKHEVTQKIFEARKQRFESLRDKVTQMVDSKETMQLRLDEMKAELEAVRMNEAHEGKYSVDDGEFKAVEDLLKDITKEVKVRKEVAEMRSASNTETATSAPVVDDTVLEDVDAYLGAK